MQKLNINPELQSLIPSLTSLEYQQLTNNILSEGIREAILTWDGTIVDGHNRYSIAQEFGIPFTTKAMQFADLNECKEWMILNQFGRRNLQAFQRSVLALELEQVFRDKAKANQGTRIDIPQKSAESYKPIETRKELAKIANVSHDTIAKVKVLQAKATDEVKQQLRTGEVSINQAYKEIKKEEKVQQRLQQIEEIKQVISNEEIKPVEDMLFDVIAIDPPWAYNETGGSGYEGYDSEGNRGTVTYPTMTLEQIADIKLPAKNNCVLFLWTTHAFLRQSFELLDNWGFAYKATMVWDKEKMGIGRTIRLQCEFCLLAVKGSPVILGSSQRDIIRESRREHSRKPLAFYTMVEAMTVGNRLDFFSREQRQNWFHYGAEVHKF